MVSPVGHALSISFAAAIPIVASGCFLPSRGADEFEPGKQPGSYYGDGDDVDASGSDGNGGCANPGSSSIHVRVRTSANGGRYAPRNVGAIWIEDGSGKFVRTMEVWGIIRRRYLSRWTTASKNNTVDAVTGATLGDHTTHDRTWNLDATERCQYGAGNYSIVIEHTDYNGDGPVTKLPFTMGTPGTVTPADEPKFHDLLIELD